MIRSLRPLLRFLPIGIGIVAVGTGGVLLVKFLYEKLRGKRIVVLGAKKTGKTLLQNFLRKGTISSNYFETKKAKLESGNFKLEDLELKISSGNDIGGSEDYIDLWDSLINQADYIIYMINIEYVLNNNLEYITKVKAHINKIRNVIRKEEDKQGEKSKKDIHVIFSCCDKILLYNENIELFEKKFNNMCEEHKLFWPGIFTFYGSLKDINEAEKLAFKFISKLIEKKS